MLPNIRDLTNNQNRSNIMNEEKKTVQKPEVEQALDEQEAAIQYLGELVEQACGTFSSVIRNEPTKEVEEEDTPESSVPIVEIIKRKTRAIKRLNSKLNELIHSCEL